VLAIVSHVDADHANLLEKFVTALRGDHERLTIVGDRADALRLSGDKLKASLGYSMLDVFQNPSKGWQLRQLTKPCRSHDDCLGELVTQ